MRRLIAVRRAVAPRDEPRYREAWRELRDAVRTRGGHAWLFRDEADDALFMEFIEYGAAAAEGASGSVVDAEPVRAARARLDEAFGRGREERWVDARE